MWPIQFYDEKIESLKKKPKYSTSFLFDWDADDNEAHLVRRYADVRLKDSKGKECPGSSLLQEEIWMTGLKDIIGDCLEKMPSGRYWFKGEYFAHQDYFGDWDCGYEGDYEPANRRTRRAVQYAGKHHGQR